MRVITLSALVLLLLGAAVSAQDLPKPEKKAVGVNYSAPKLTVSGADKSIAIGELVVLDAVLDGSPKDMTAVSYSWTVLPTNKNIVTWPDGAKIIFGTGTKPQNVTVILTASMVFATKEADKITDISLKTATTIVTVRITDAGPDNNTDPVKPDPIIPSPVKPESEVSKKTLSWVKLVKTSAKYKDANLRSDANAIADNFDKIASATAAGTLKGANAILKATKEANDSAVSNRDEWLPFFNELSDFLQSANKSGTLKTDDQYASTWREIAKGIRNAIK